MNGLKNIAIVAQTGTIWKRSADQEENISSRPVEIGVNNSDQSTGARGCSAAPVKDQQHQ